VGSPPPPEAVAAARRLGVDLEGHQSVALTREMLREADAVFVFDERNVAGVLAIDPRALTHLHLLGALNPDGPAMIDDPYEMPTEDIERVFRQIGSAVERGG
jgi:protein-tyrosine-phosphatase